MSVETFKVKNIHVANIYNPSPIVFFGIGVLCGSNYETKEISGVAHFSEHLAFKFTKTRNWKQINEEFAKLGACSNAGTSNSDVLYHATCPKESTEKVISLMLDMFFNSTYPSEEIEKERTVIIEEKKSYEDNPGISFSNAIGNNLFDWSVGHDTIGTFDTIKSISREQIIQYLNDKIDLDNFIFICCGDIKSKDLKKYIEKNIPDKHNYLKKRDGLHKVDSRGFWKKEVLKNKNKIKFLMEKDNITQSHAYMIIDAVPGDDPMFYTEAILFDGIGGGLFSELSSRIREELGLCYSVGMFSLSMSYPERRIANLYGYVSPENVDKFMIESEKVLKKVIKNGLDKNIFECAKTSYLSSVLRQIETSTGKAMYLKTKLLIYKKASLEESLKKIRSVKIQDCNELAKKILQVRYNWAIMNPKK